MFHIRVRIKTTVCSILSIAILFLTSADAKDRKEKDKEAKPFSSQPSNAFKPQANDRDNRRTTPSSETPRPKLDNNSPRNDSSPKPSFRSDPPQGNDRRNDSSPAFTNKPGSGFGGGTIQTNPIVSGDKLRSGRDGANDRAKEPEKKVAPFEGKSTGTKPPMFNSGSNFGKGNNDLKPTSPKDNRGDAREPRKDSSPKLGNDKPQNPSLDLPKTEKIPEGNNPSRTGTGFKFGEGTTGGFDKNKAAGSDRRDKKDSTPLNTGNPNNKTEVVRPGTRPGVEPSLDRDGFGKKAKTENVFSSGKSDFKGKTTQIRIDKNGTTPKIVTSKLPADSEVSSKVTKLWQTKDRKEFDKQLKEIHDHPELKSDPRLTGIKIDRVSGAFQHRIENHEQDARLKHWNASDTGRKLNLERQFALHRQGDICRQMNLNQVLIQNGGWQNRRHGVVAASFTTTSFSSWYAGCGHYPKYCWTPRWTAWVDWCWWDTCLPVYDPRPVYCRPIIYNPCPTWVVYEYPVWQPLPVVRCGTWVDVPVSVSSGTDMQLLAVRFVDNGHQEQNLGPRFRVWLRNNGVASTNQPFNVLLVASNSEQALPDLPQSGAVVNGLEAGQIQAIDIRLPLAANKMVVTPEGLKTPFNFLHVLVDSHRDLQELDETNNGAVVSRFDVLPVDPAAFSSDVTAATPGTIINVAGEGFGPEPGQVIVAVNGQEIQAEIYGWYDLGVRFVVPNIALAQVTDADILVVRGDGAASNPLDLDLAPQNMIDEGPLPPPPSP